MLTPSPALQGVFAGLGENGISFVGHTQQRFLNDFSGVCATVQLSRVDLLRVAT